MSLKANKNKTNKNKVNKNKVNKNKTNKNKANKNKTNKNKFNQKGGFNFGIGPYKIIHDLVSKTLTIFVSKLIKNVPATGRFINYQPNEIVEEMLQESTIQLKIKTISNKIISQINLTVLMVWNAIIVLYLSLLYPG